MKTNGSLGGQNSGGRSAGARSSRARSTLLKALRSLDRQIGALDLLIKKWSYANLHAACGRTRWFKVMESKRMKLDTKRKEVRLARKEYNPKHEPART